MTRAFEIVVANAQRAKKLNRKILREVAEFILTEKSVEQAELGLHFVSGKEIADVHVEFMNIEGSTDVITFDHGSEPPAKIHGEIFISVEDAIKQAREFQTTWQSEVARYIAHGILHLLGYDDLKPRARTEMKRIENALVRKIETQFNLPQIEVSKRRSETSPAFQRRVARTQNATVPKGRLKRSHAK